MSSTDRRMDGRTDGPTDGRTRWIQYTPPPTSLGWGIKMYNDNIPYFSKPWDTILSGSPGLVLSCPVLPCLALSGFLIIFNGIHPQGHCVNHLQAVLRTVISMYGSALIWARQDKARRAKTWRSVALHHPGKAGRMSWFWKILHLHMKNVNACAI